MKKQNKPLVTFFNMLATCEKASPQIQIAWRMLTDFERSFIITAKANGFGTLKTVEQYTQAVTAWKSKQADEIIETPKL
jgi:hypothetical protein